MRGGLLSELADWPAAKFSAVATHPTWTCITDWLSLRRCCASSGSSGFPLHVLSAQCRATVRIVRIQLRVTLNCLPANASAMNGACMGPYVGTVHTSVLGGSPHLLYPAGKCTRCSSMLGLLRLSQAPQAPYPQVSSEWAAIGRHVRAWASATLLHIRRGWCCLVQPAYPGLLMTPRVTHFFHTVSKAHLESI